MMPEFEKAAFALKVGQVSDVIRTPVGFHIIKVTERYEDNSHSMWFAAERLRALNDFRRKLQESAKIERFI
jgi:parvulin-like peptidyl-prolyl isomerase